MKIGIYARGLSEKVGGPKEYIKLMCESIIDTIPKEDQLFIFHNLKERYFKTKKINVKEIMIKSKNKIICDFIIAPRIINKYNLDVVWFPKNVIPFFIKTKKIVSILDLGYFLPELNAYPLLDTKYMKFMVRTSCKRADKIIAISQNTKKDIVNLLKINPNKIDVVYLAAGSKYKVIKDKKNLDMVKKKYNLSKKFILFTGTISPRKNLVRLINAFNKISEGIPHELIITGSKTWKDKEVTSLIENNKKVRRIGLVDDEDMPALYNLADIYIYPSLYEGFGLPILEAQACGCPVITSNTSSIPEVGGDSVLYIDPYSEDSIKNAILELSRNKKTKKKLLLDGFKNAEKFSWKKSSYKILKICEEF